MPRSVQISHGGKHVKVEKTGCIEPGKNHGDQAIGRSDREIEVLVDDDESHSNGNDGNPRRVTKHCMESLSRPEERGIDNSAAKIEQQEQGEEARFPATGDLGRCGAEPCHRAKRHRFFDPTSWLQHVAGARVASRNDLRLSELHQFSKRLPTVPTVSCVTSCARVSRLAAAMPRSICR